MKTGHICRTTVLTSVLLSIFFLPRDAVAQRVGFQAGASIDPDQIFIGSHFESGEIARGLHLRPSIDGGFGDGIKRATVNIDFLYRQRIGAGDWSLYQGGGPAIHIVKVDGVDDRDVSGGVQGIFGFGHVSGFFAEFRGAGGGGPNLTFAVGYTVRR